MIETENKITDATVSVKSERNYELDFLKLFFAVLVFIFHSRVFIGENTRISISGQLGAVSVHFFFVVSGMLMVRSILKKDFSNSNTGKMSMLFVLNKYKAIAWEINIALLIKLCVDVILADSVKKVPRLLVCVFPELFMITRSGVSIEYNGVTWYLSAMLLVMLPIVYLLYTKIDFTLYILAPIVAIFTLGYMCQSNKYGFFQQDKLYVMFMGGTIRAACGLCFGICAYNIYIFLLKLKANKNTRIFLTITEILLYAVMFWVFLIFKEKKAIMSVILLMPIAVAITFSQKSYVESLFKFKWMKCFAPLSLSIYLNHIAARGIVDKFLEGQSFKKCILIMALVTIILCLIHFVLIKIGKWLWNSKLKALFTKPDIE